VRDEALDVRIAEQRAPRERFVRFHVRREHDQHVVGLAGYVVALLHFGTLRHFLTEAIEVGGGFAVGTELIEDGLVPEISEGAGTIALELYARDEAYDAVVVPLGNGALLNGMARWIKAVSPATRVIGVASAGASAMADSWRERRCVEHARADTIADGIAVRVPIAAALDDMRDIVDDVLLVDDDALIDAMRRVHVHHGLVIEPAGAAGLAALIAHAPAFARQRVATVLAGGNLTAQQVRQWLAA